MKIDYNVTLKQEVLREVAANISADFSRYMNENDIDYTDDDNEIAGLASESFDMKQRILVECHSLEDLEPFENRIKEMKKILKELQDGQSISSELYAKAAY
ncbi:hypothetical protein FACS189499_07640 [Clostridia bacterium]|nr:hypothetical protein FACS189499_07640 [Clostridia bacterium]